MKTLIKGAHIVTCDNKNTTLVGDVLIEDNLIKFVGNYKGAYDKIIDGSGKILMPGFVNTHSHATMSLFRNLGENTTFENWWYDVMRPLEEKLTPKDYELGVTLAILEMYRNGITSFTDMYMHGDITAKLSAKYGARCHVCIGAITGKEILDEAELDRQRDLVLKANPNAKIVPCAHAIYSCDESQIAEVARYARLHKLPLTIHCSETMVEVGECYTKYGLTPIGYLESLGFFDGTKCVLAHCVHADKDDVEILKKYDVSIASNPSSNLILGSGVAPIYSFMNNGLNVCLGTDGAASNNSLDFFKEMFLLDNLQAGVLNKSKALTCAQTLRCATVNGARGLGYNNLGIIASGYLADLVLVDANAVNMQPSNDDICAIVNSANVSNVYMTMVDGNIVYLDGKYTFDVDLDKLYKEANKAITRLQSIEK